jgi:hypothetical protein
VPNEIRRLDLPPGVHGIVNHLTAELEKQNIKELYVVVRDGDELYYECVSGNISGLSFSILVLQDYALKSMRGAEGNGSI